MVDSTLFFLTSSLFSYSFSFCLSSFYFFLLFNGIQWYSFSNCFFYTTYSIICLPHESIICVSYIFRMSSCHKQLSQPVVTTSWLVFTLIRASLAVTRILYCPNKINFQFTSIQTCITVQQEKQRMTLSNKVKSGLVDTNSHVTPAGYIWEKYPRAD